jgi:hypothetical protein
MHIYYTTPHGILLIIAWIFALGALIPWGSSPLARVMWFGWSWMFFVAAFVFFGA